MSARKVRSSGTGASWFAAAMAGTLLAAAAGCLPTVNPNSVPLSAREAARLAQTSPRPTWQQFVATHECDVLAFVSPERVLVGTLSKKEASLAFVRTYSDEPGEFLMLDASDGRILWRVPRASFGGRQTLFAGDPAILVRSVVGDSVKFVALDPASGSTLWTKELPASVRTALAPDGQRIVFGQMDSSALKLSAVSAKDGKSVWSASVDGTGSNAQAPFDLVTAGDGLYAVGPQVARLAPDTGKVLWKTAFPGTWDAQSIVFPGGESVAMTDGARISVVDASTGASVWSAPVAGGKVTALTTTDEGVLLFVAGQGRGEVRMHAKNGSPMWTSPVPSALRSPLLSLPGKIAFATSSTFYLLDASDGSPKGKTEIPAELQGESLPDLLAVEGDRIAVARESGVAVFSSTDGTLAFSRALEEGKIYTSPFLKRKLSQIAEALERQAKQTGGVVKLDNSWTNVQYQMALQNQRRVFDSTRATMNSSGSSSGERQAALGRSEAAASATLMQGQMAASLNLALAGAQTGFAIGSALAAIANAPLQTHVPALMSRLQLKLATSAGTHAASLRGGYYVRPVSRDGWRLVVIRLSDGASSDIVLSPPNTPLRFADFSDLPAFAMGRGKGLVVAKGLGLDPAKWQPEDLEIRIQIDRKLPVWKVPRASVLAFELGRLDFSSAAPAARSTSRGDLATAQVRAALRKCDAGELKQTLGTLAPNARDADGRTVLMHAVQLECLEGVKILLSKGADTTLVDDEALSAFDYNFLPPNFAGDQKHWSAVGEAIQEAFYATGRPVPAE